MAYGHQTWQSDDLLCEVSIHKVAKPFEHVVTWGYVIN